MSETKFNILDIVEYLKNKINFLNDKETEQDEDEHLKHLQKCLSDTLNHIYEIETKKGNVKIELIGESVWARPCYQLLNNPVCDARFKYGDVILDNVDPSKIRKVYFNAS